MLSERLAMLSERLVMLSEAKHLLFPPLAGEQPPRLAAKQPGMGFASKVFLGDLLGPDGR